MADQGIREIQLSGKQLVFLFMASVVLAVAIFLLGISVGRGVRGTPAGASMAEGTTVTTADTPAPVEMPPPTVTTPADLSYHTQLQGDGASPAQKDAAAAAPAEPPAPVDDAPAAGSETASRAASNAPPPAAPAAASPTAAAAATPSHDAARPARAAAEPARAPASGGWVVQVNAFRSKANADREVAQLKGKGYAAFAVSSTPGPLYHVRVGPFSQRGEADRTAARLQREEGLKPLVTR